MKFLIGLSILLLSINVVLGQSSSCACSDSSLCEPVSVGERLEFVGFSEQPQEEYWSNYDWNVLTTLSVFYPLSSLNPELVCLAHSKQTRIVIGSGFPVSQLTNFTAQDEWIQQQIQLVQQYNIDGLNIDVEDVIGENETDISALLTGFVAKAYYEFKKVNPNYQVTFDVAWSANCIDVRCYDYQGIAQATDFIVIMDYDTESQIITDHCVALANAPAHTAWQGIASFLDLGIPAEKLVLAVPWYGYDYPCIDKGMTLNQSVCTIKWDEYRGVNCSDAAGIQLDFSVIFEMLGDTSLERTPQQWSSSSMTPWFNYVNQHDGMIHQIWFDDPQSLSIKVDIAQYFNILGMGTWNIDFLNVTQSQTSQIWSSMASFYNQNRENNIKDILDV